MTYYVVDKTKYIDLGLKFIIIMIWQYFIGECQKYKAFILYFVQVDAMR